MAPKGRRFAGWGVPTASLLIKMLFAVFYTGPIGGFIPCLYICLGWSIIFVSLEIKIGDVFATWGRCLGAGAPASLRGARRF